MNKRFLSLVLCMCMLCTAGVALADNEVTYPENQTTTFNTPVDVEITAIAKNTAVEDAEDVYSVEIVWGDMKFAYGYSSESTTAEWDPATHTYKMTTEDGNDATKGWYMLNESTSLTNTGAVELGLTTQDAVLVFNHSNKPVDVKIAIEDITADGGDTEELKAKFATTGGETTSTDGSTYTLSAGVEQDVYNKDTASVYGKVSMESDKTEYTTSTPIAKLNVTISKPATENE